MARIVTDYLDEICEQYSEKVAISEEYRQISFRELRDQSRAIASALAHGGGIP